MSEDSDSQVSFQGQCTTYIVTLRIYKNRLSLHVGSLQTEEDRPLFRPFTRESLAQIEARIQEENEKKKELEKKRAEGEVSVCMFYFYELARASTVFHRSSALESRLGWQCREGRNSASRSSCPCVLADSLAAVGGLRLGASHAKC